MKLTVNDARAKLAACGDSDALRELCESIMESWFDCQNRLDDSESEVASAYENAEELSGQVGRLEDKLESFEGIPALVDKILGHENAVSESLDTYNLRRAVDDIRSM